MHRSADHVMQGTSWRDQGEYVGIFGHAEVNNHRTIVFSCLLYGRSQFGLARDAQRLDAVRSGQFDEIGLQ